MPNFHYLLLEFRRKVGSKNDFKLSYLASVEGSAEPDIHVIFEEGGVALHKLNRVGIHQTRGRGRSSQTKQSRNSPKLKEGSHFTN